MYGGQISIIPIAIGIVVLRPALTDHSLVLSGNYWAEEKPRRTQRKKHKDHRHCLRIPCKNFVSSVVK